MRLRSQLVTLVAAAALLAGCAGASAEAARARAPSSAASGQLTARETATLMRGDQVVRPSVFERDGARYVGGVAYQVVEAPARVVLEAVGSPALLQRMLPKTKSVTEVDGAARRLEVRQGNDWVEAKYTVAFEEASSKDEIRFFLDATRPHDPQDLYGFFRVKALGNGRTLVTMGVALDLGPGLVRMLFEKRIQELMLTTPRRVRDVIEGESSRELLVARSELP
jgi:hypothetical protein